MVIKMNDKYEEMDSPQLRNEIYVILRDIESKYLTLMSNLYLNALKTYADNKNIHSSEELMEDLGIVPKEEHDYFLPETVMYHTSVVDNNERISYLIRDIQKDLDFISDSLNMKIDFMRNKPTNEELLKYVRFNDVEY